MEYGGKVSVVAYGWRNDRHVGGIADRLQVVAGRGYNEVIAIRRMRWQSLPDDVGSLLIERKSMYTARVNQLKRFLDGADVGSDDIWVLCSDR